MVPMIISWYAWIFWIERKKMWIAMFDILLDYIELRIQMCAQFFRCCCCRCHFDNPMNGFLLIGKPNDNNEQKQWHFENEPQTTKWWCVNTKATVFDKWWDLEFVVRIKFVMVKWELMPDRWCTSTVWSLLDLNWMCQITNYVSTSATHACIHLLKKTNGLWHDIGWYWCCCNHNSQWTWFFIRLKWKENSDFPKHWCNALMACFFFSFDSPWVQNVETEM